MPVDLANGQTFANAYQIPAQDGTGVNGTTVRGDRTQRAHPNLRYDQGSPSVYRRTYPK